MLHALLKNIFQIDRQSMTVLQENIATSLKYWSSMPMPIKSSFIQFYPSINWRMQKCKLYPSSIACHISLKCQSGIMPDISGYMSYVFSPWFICQFHEIWKDKTTVQTGRPLEVMWCGYLNNCVRYEW
jgi:hypothetical protein